MQGGTSGSGAAIPGPPAPAESPKVSLWSDDDYIPADDADRHASREGQTAKSAAVAGSGAADRAPGFFPGPARDKDSAEDDEYYGEDDEPRREPRSMRWLVGGLLAAVLVVGLVLAVTNLGSLFKSNPAAQRRRRHRHERPRGDLGRAVRYRKPRAGHRSARH